MFRKAIALLLVFFLFWGNVGFCLNVHYCSTSENFTLVVNHLLGETCETEEAQTSLQEESCHAESKSCCKLKEKEPAPTKSCCEDNEVEIKMPGAYHGTQFNVTFHQVFAAEYFIDTLFYFLTGGPDSRLAYVLSTKPPEIPDYIEPSGKTILVKHCVYRI